MKYYLLLAGVCTINGFDMPPFTKQQITEIGTKIWQNESGCSIEKLTFWKSGEEFPSLGINHFIWFPATYHGPFTQTFPTLLKFLQNKGVTLPAWLPTTSACPWATRTAFYNDINSAKMIQLRTLLHNTIDLQTEFIIEQFRERIEQMLAGVTVKQRDHLEQLCHDMARTPAGLFALIDYINFKGEGVRVGERYQQQGWGLLQVLEGMHSSPNPVHEFVAVAKQLLTTRVYNAPPERHEERWLAGWCNRVTRYLN